MELHHQATPAAIVAVVLLNVLSAASSFYQEPADRGYLSRSGLPTLNVSSELKIRALPGNHDKFADNVATPNSRNFELIFSKCLSNFTESVGHWVNHKHGRYLGFVYDDFSLRQRRDARDPAIGVYGQGRVY